VELVAEIGPADGDLAYALEVCTAAKEAGFDWVKAQFYDRDRLTTRTAETYAQPGIKVPTTQYEDFAKQLNYGQWATVAEHCATIGIGFFASVFDIEAVKFCEFFGVKRYKIASGDITYRQLIEAASDTGEEVIVSTGAATEAEIARTAKWVKSPLTLLACTLSYPCEVEDANLRRMEPLRAFTDSVGYSDHTRGTGAIIRAKELGADMVEKHFTIRPGTGGDHDFAVTPEEMAGIRWEAGLSDYDGRPSLAPTESEMRARHGARRSIVAVKDLPQGTVLSAEHVAFLRPGGGLEPWQYAKFAGRPLWKNVPSGVALTAEMF
jgi:N-acetylneuraminate synthase